MKKVLFVLGLAMCTTMAMAQAKKVVPKVGEGPQKANITVDAQAPVDYKGSIFTKDDDVVVKTFNFAKDEMTGIVYGVNGAIKAGDVVNVDGTDYTYTSANDHGRSESNTYWGRVDATDSIGSGSSFNNTYPNAIQYGATYIPAYMGSQNGITDNNGFMFVSMIEYMNNTGKGNINTYFQLPAVDIPEGTKVMDVQWRQYYRKFYDTCYVDYLKGGKWYGVEVNVPNVDVNVNATATPLYTLTLPPAAADQSTLTIRFRVAASDASQVYGYFWTIDNVSFIVPAATTRWRFVQSAYLDGFYGILPQDFNIPVAYATYARNAGVDNLTGNKLSIIDVTNNGSEEVLSVNQPSINAGAPSKNTLFRISERGFSSKDRGLGYPDVQYQAYADFWENRAGYGESDPSFYTGYGLRGLPTENAGLNQFSMVASNDQGLNTVLDTMGYYVSPYVEADSKFGITVEGYRWGNDNGIVASQSEYAYQFTNDGYVTDDIDGGHQYEKGYQTFVRFNTPNVIPEENGEPWVFRGLELVTATTLTSDEVSGVRITPISLVMMKDPNNEDSVNIYYSTVTGYATDAMVTVTGNSAADEVEYGYALPSQKSHVVNILFPNQPEIVPNTSYFFGYEIAEGGRFAVAGQQTAYYENADSMTYYYENPVTDPYYRRFTPLYKMWDVYSYDGTYSRGITGYNITRYPLIRVIVGPKLDIPQHTVTLQCIDDTTYWMTTGADEDMCGMVDTIAEGSTSAYYVIPGSINEMLESESYYGHMVIDEILVDGQPIDLTDENIVSVIEYNVYNNEHGPDSDEPWPALLERNYYRVTIRDIDADHTISAKASWHELGIEEAENMVQIGLAPNPATSQVRLNVTGMTGKVNCSIIDMSGREVYSSSFNAGSEQTISLSGVPAGAYFVRVTNDTFSKVEKLIVR